MPVQAYRFPFAWSHIKHPGIDRETVLALEAKLHEIQLSWAETQYLAGQNVRGSDQGCGVDCIRFTASCLDEPSGSKHSDEIPRLPQDIGMHKPESARAIMRQLIRMFGLKSVDDGRAEPFDIIMVGQAGAGPGHAQIVGAKPNTIWEAVRPKVCQGGWIYYNTTEVCGVYRKEDKREWVESLLG